MKYEEVETIETLSESKSLKLVNNKFPKKLFRLFFSLSFAVLFFANVISITCIVSSNFKTSIISAFSSFDIDEITNSEDNYFYNLFNDKSNFKFVQEFDLPINSEYSILENALIFSIFVDSQVLSVSNGKVSLLSLDKKEIQITNEGYVFHYLNLNSTWIIENQNVFQGQAIGDIKADSKLYFFVTKEDVRLNIKIQNQRVIISE